jgi:hypothetical protein
MNFIDSDFGGLVLTGVARQGVHVDQQRAWGDRSCDLDEEFDHAADISSPLPALAPLSGQSPRERLVDAVVKGDFATLRAELETDASALNDPIAGVGGKTVLHLSARLYGLHSKRHAHEMAKTYDQIIQLLLASGADPLARDEAFQFPSSYTDGFTPPCLRERMLRAAQEQQVGWNEQKKCAEPRFRVNATHPWAGNGKGRLTRRAIALDQKFPNRRRGMCG